MTDEESASANSELRYITLELMKIANKKKKRFKEVARDFIRNVYSLRRLVKKSSHIGKATETKKSAETANKKTQ